MPKDTRARPLPCADLSSITNFCESFKSKHSSLHILLENAAVCGVPNVPVSGTGFEPCLASNHFGHLFLRHHLEPILAASAPSRVVVVASALHDRMFTQEPVTLDLDSGDVNISAGRLRLILIRPSNGWRILVQSYAMSSLHLEQASDLRRKV